MVSRRFNCTVAVDPLMSSAAIVIATCCEVTARKPSSMRRCSSAVIFGLTVRNSARSLVSIARPYAAITRRIAASSLSAERAAAAGGSRRSAASVRGDGGGATAGAGATAGCEGGDAGALAAGGGTAGDAGVVGSTRGASRDGVRETIGSACAGGIGRGVSRGGGVRETIGSPCDGGVGACGDGRGAG